MVSRDVIHIRRHGRRERELSAGTHDSRDLFQIRETGTGDLQEDLWQAIRKMKLGFIEGVSFHTMIYFPSSTVLHFQAH